MSSIDFIEFKSAPTVQEAFNALVKKAEEYYGTNPYNGTISTCYLDTSEPPVKIADTWSEETKILATEYAAKERGIKWYAKPLDCGTYKNSHMWAFYGLAAT